MEEDFSNSAAHHQGMADHARDEAAAEMGLTWENLDRAVSLMSTMEARIEEWGLRPFDGDGRHILNLIADIIRGKRGEPNAL